MYMYIYIYTRIYTYKIKRSKVHKMVKGMKYININASGNYRRRFKGVVYWFIS